MKTSKALIILSLLVGLLAIVQAGAGLFWPDGGSPFPFTTLHGQQVQINGQGIYAYDTTFKAPIFRGTDAITLFVCVPLLIIAVLLYRRGSLRGQILLASVLAYFLYNSASVVLGVAYNNLFLVYTAFFSASLFAFILSLAAIDLQSLPARVSAGFPRRGMAGLMFVAGLAVLFAWLGDIVSALLRGTVPEIASYTTEVTYAIDLGIIVPASILAGILLLRRAPVGYLLGAILTILLAIIGVLVATQTVFQSMAGITLSPGQFAGKAGSFMILSLVAVYMIARLFRAISEPDGRNGTRTGTDRTEKA